MFVVCSEHIERAIDEFVEMYEASPDIYLLKDISFTAWSAPACCDFCQDMPHYLVV